MAVTALDPAAYEDLVRRALAEDVGAGDVTTQATVPAGVRGAGILLAKSRLVVAGLDVAQSGLQGGRRRPRTWLRSPGG